MRRYEVEKVTYERDTLIISFSSDEEKNRFANGSFVRSWQQRLPDKAITSTQFISGYNHGAFPYEIYLKDLFIQRVRPPRFVFHKTGKENKSAIERFGLRPTKNAAEYGRESYDKPFVFASMKAKNLFGQFDGDIWVIDTHQIDNKWFIDFNFPKDNNHIITDKPIPPTALTRMTETAFMKSKYNR